MSKKNNDATIPLRIWIPPSKSYRLNVGDVKKILEKVDDRFLFTIDDFEMIFWEIDDETETIDFTRDYKGS